MTSAAMKKLLVPLIVLFSMVIAPKRAALEAAEFQKAPDACKNAHAILGWSDFNPGPDETDDEFAERKKQPWVKVGWVVGRLNWGRTPGNFLLEMVSKYEPGKYGQAEFKEYAVKGHDNGKAYVAHCGHGGTCNMIASRVHNLYKGIGRPTVYCGETALPKMLTAGSAPEIPLPTEEELNEADDDDDFDFDDDDDDDDDDEGEDEPSVDDF
jgi:hypothetical protein